ncbi:MAG TPA: hypothetical protein VGY98_04260 [Verrucomicrobiae bacterium]|nr:hypothetical protein [Verrucomicrobiae bacterium]
MKANGYEAANAGSGTAFSKACRACYERILAQIQKARESMLNEARETMAVPERLIRLAVNEAEALAWQTLYPQLVFPDLAMEKIRDASHWNERQRSLR